MPETSKKFDLLRKLFVHTVVVDTQDVIMATRKILVESDLKVAILTDEILSFLQKNNAINFLEIFCTLIITAYSNRNFRVPFSMFKAEK